jgi:RNA polymerase sigma-70 factor (ECF subfamily)
MYPKDRTGVYNEVVRRYWGPMLVFARNKLNDDELSEDVVQETFARVHRHLENFNPQKALLRTWLYTIAMNLVKNEYRNRTRNDKVFFTPMNGYRPGESAAWCDPSPGPDAVLEAEELKHNVRLVLGLLEEHHKIPLQMRFVQDMTYEEMAEALSIPIGTVKSRLHRARESFENLWKSLNRENSMSA